MDKTLILRRIDELRKERHWTINELAEHTNLASGTIYEWFNTKKDRNPSLEGIAEICNAFEISLYTFFASDITSRMSAKQNELLESFEKLNPEQIEVILSMAKAFIKYK